MSDVKTDQVTEKPASWQDKTLKAAGIGYTVGDLSMMAAGRARGKSGADTVKGAMVWFIGGIAAAVWGHPDPQTQLQIQASKLEQYVRQKGVEIPDDARAQSALLKKRSFMQHVSEFLYTHPSEMLNTMYMIGAAMLLHGSLKPEARKLPLIPKTLDLKGMSGMNSDFWIGALVLGGSTTGLLVKEDPQARKKAEGKGVLQQIHAYVAEKPLRVTGTLYGLNNIFLGTKALQDYSKRSTEYASQSLKPHMASTAQLAAYVFSNIMLMLSPRDRGDSVMPTESVTKLEEAAAHIIAAQTPDQQKELLRDLSHYMAEQKGMQLSAPEIAQQLEMRLAAITQAHTNTSWAAREEARPVMPSPGIA